MIIKKMRFLSEMLYSLLGPSGAFLVYGEEKRLQGYLAHKKSPPPKELP
jgi:hypothetical protein